LFSCAAWPLAISRTAWLGKYCRHGAGTLPQRVYDGPVEGGALEPWVARVRRLTEIARALAVAKRIESGICHINGPTVADEA
jgi:hypothetical protein